MKKCSSRNSVGLNSSVCSPAYTRKVAGSSRRPAISIGSSETSGAERLGDVVVGAHVEALQLVALLRAGGQHDDRQLRGAWIGAQPLRELDARLAREHPVEQHQVGQAGVELGACGFGGLGFADGVAGVPQVYRDQLADGRLVLDDQDLGVHDARL
jgi:hypothetical protein